MKDRDPQILELLDVKFVDDPVDMLSAAPTTNTRRSDETKSRVAIEFVSYAESN
jgi:hypothetical protein